MCNSLSCDSLRTMTLYPCWRKAEASALASSGCVTAAICTMKVPLLVATGTGAVVDATGNDAGLVSGVVAAGLAAGACGSAVCFTAGADVWLAASSGVESWSRDSVTSVGSGLLVVAGRRLSIADGLGVFDTDGAEPGWRVPGAGGLASVPRRPVE